MHSVAQAHSQELRPAATGPRRGPAPSKLPRLAIASAADSAGIGRPKRVHPRGEVEGGIDNAPKHVGSMAQAPAVRQLCFHSSAQDSIRAPPRAESYPLPSTTGRLKSYRPDLR